MHKYTRRNYKLNFPGIKCKYCPSNCTTGGGSRIFSSSIKTFSDSSKTIEKMYHHISKCHHAPLDVKNKLIKLRTEKKNEKHQNLSMKTFYKRVWDKLHS